MTGSRALRALAVLAAMSAPAAGRSVVDGTGAAVQLVDRPERIVALAPELAEIAGQLGAGEALVGRCDACDRGVPATAASVGSLISPSIEGVLALRPDLVLASSQGNPLDVLLRLRELGVPIVGITPKSKGLGAVVDEVRAVASAMGRVDEGERIASLFEDRIAAVRARTAGLPRVSACCFAWLDPLVAAGRGSFLDDLLDACGADNACAGSGSEYPKLSREELLLARPDVILTATGHADGASAFGGWARTIPAVGRGRVIDLDADLFLRPTPRLADAADRLVEILAPLRPAAPRASE